VETLERTGRSVVRVLITGSNGQLGCELVEVFEKPGHHDVIATDRSTLDVTNRDAALGVITSLTPDVIVHAAAWTAVDACEADLERAFLANAMSSRFICDGARTVGARVVYVSTDYVFDGSKDGAYTEWDEPNPQSAYGKSKLGGERETGDGDTIVRTSWVFGRYGQNMVKTILRLAADHPELAFVDDQHGKPTCAQDLAGAIYQLVVGRHPGIFHVTNENPTTWYEFARSVLLVAGQNPDRVRPIHTAEMVPPRPAPRPANSVLDNGALRFSGLPALADHREALERVVKDLLQ